MKFKKYNSIENSYREFYINKIHEYGLNSGDWVVSEKIHGANFSIWYDGINIKYAKRTSFIEEGEKFYNYKDVIKLCKLDKKIKEIWNLINQEWKNYNHDHEPNLLILYGELFGGSYSHPDVEKSQQSHIQKGVFYCPEQRFYCFDIKINGSYIPYNIMEKLCKKVDLFYAESLFIGSFDECLKYPNDNPTIIPSKLFLPKIDDNIMEGIVIKPVNPVFFPNGERVILKNKNEKFTEKQRKPRKKKKQNKKLSQEEQELLNNLLEYLNENRLRAVLSKIGMVTKKEFGKLQGMIAKDVIEDFIKDTSSFNTLENDSRKAITKAFNREVANFIRPNFLNIIDGIY